MKKANEEKTSKHNQSWARVSLDLAKAVSERSEPWDYHVLSFTIPTIREAYSIFEDESSLFEEMRKTRAYRGLVVTTALHERTAARIIINNLHGPNSKPYRELGRRGRPGSREWKANNKAIVRRYTTTPLSFTAVERIFYWLRRARRMIAARYIEEYAE